MLIACLYRPAAKKNTFSDMREDFDLAKIELYSNYTSNFHLEVKIAILVFFMGCRNHINEKFKAVFSSTNTTKKVDKSGWLGFFYDLAGPKTGTFHDVAAYNIYELFVILEKLILDAEQQKRSHKSKK